MKQINNIKQNSNISLLSLKKVGMSEDRHFPISTNTWGNSTYNYNKNITKNIPFLDMFVNNLIKMYFYLNSNINLDSKFRRRRTKRRRYSGNRTFVSKAEMKHNNDKTVITVYTYNKPKKHIYKRLFFIYNKLFKNYSKDNYTKSLLKNFYTNKNLKTNKKIIFLKRFLRRKKSFFILKKLIFVRYIKSYINKKLYFNYNIFNKLNIIHSKSIKLLGNFVYKSKLLINILEENNLTYLTDKLKKGNAILFNTKKRENALYINKLQNNYIKESLSNEMLYMKYNQISLIEDYKYTNIYLNKLSNILSKIYNKKIEFNLVNLKYIHLDSKILSDSIVQKLRKRKNTPLRVMKKALLLAKISRNNYNYNVKQKFITNYNLLNMFNINNNSMGEDKLNQILSKLFNNKIYSYNIKFKDKYIYRSIKLRKIKGIRLETKGRLSKRLTAARSVYKYKYKGSLQNQENAEGLSSVLLKGYLKSNIDFVNVNSKTRNGSFGLKGWISSK